MSITTWRVIDSAKTLRLALIGCFQFALGKGRGA